MSCTTVTGVIQTQLFLWATAVISWVEQQCMTVVQQIVQWQQQWQNQCMTVSSQVCQSLPWPLSALCGWVTSLVCTLVSVLVKVVVAVATLVCSLVTVFVTVLILTILTVLLPVIWILCVVIPCSDTMESPMPPDAGWLVTLGAESPMLLSTANAVEVLADGDAAGRAISEAVAAATSSVHVLQLEFNPAFVARFPPSTTVTDAPSFLTELLAVNRQGTDVRILLNDNLWISSVNDVRMALLKAAPNSIQVQGLHVFPEVMHGKAVIVDGSIAFLVGLPFNQGYWDTQLHPVSDPAQRGAGAGGDATALGKNLLGDVGNGVGNKPVHTVTIRVEGQAAADIDTTFVSLWNGTAAPSKLNPPAPVEGNGTQAVQIVRTLPPLASSGFPQGEKGVLEAYLRAINNARSFIYMEEQYVTYPVIGQALIRALSANPGLQLILLLNENPDQPTYKVWQNSLLSGLLAFPSSQVGMFSPWRTTAGGDGAPVEIMQCYVEAKVAIADDEWATIGSGNLDGSSLGHLFELLPSPLSCLSGPRGWRNIELNAILFDGIAGQSATGNVRDLRTLLWREHLGAGALPEGEAPPAGGWLSIWSRVAAANVSSLNATQQMTGTPDAPSRILPYAQALEPPAQLSSVGVNIAPFNVAPAVP